MVYRQPGPPVLQIIGNIFRDVKINLPQPEQLLARRADPRLHVALRLRHLQF